MSEPVIVARDQAVSVIVLNRPDKRNALDLTIRAAIAATVRELEVDYAIRALVRTGGDLNLLVDQRAQAVADIDLAQYWSGPKAWSNHLAQYLEHIAQARAAPKDTGIAVALGVGICLIHKARYASRVSPTEDFKCRVFSKTVVNLV